MNLLAADIGGTKTLLGIYKSDKVVTKLFSKKYSSKEWQKFELMLENFMATLPSNLERPSYGCIAVAGKSNNEEIKTTNLPWVLNKKIICKVGNLKDLSLENDFSVLIYGIPFLQSEQYLTIHNPKKTNYSNIENNIFAVIGAGTGLGIARGINTSNMIISIPSEGGHKEFAPRTNMEWELLNWLKKDLELTRVSIERVVSGTGLGNIARWRLLQNDGENHPLRKLAENYLTSKFSKLPELASSYAKKGDPLMREVLEIWLGAYGSVVGDLALHELCTQGLWIGGGTASKHLEGISSKTFQSALRDKGRFSEFLNEVPIMVIIDPEAGLFSAACKAHMMAKSIGCQSPKY